MTKSRWHCFESIISLFRFFNGIERNDIKRHFFIVIGFIKLYIVKLIVKYEIVIIDESMYNYVYSLPFLHIQPYAANIFSFIITIYTY